MFSVGRTALSLWAWDSDARGPRPRDLEREDRLKGTDRSVRPVGGE